jgi:hypothetical protein
MAQFTKEEVSRKGARTKTQRRKEKLHFAPLRELCAFCVKLF